VLTKKPTFDDKIGIQMDRSSIFCRSLAVVAAAAALWGGSVFSSCAADGKHGETAVTCTNPASGASWQIMIDYDRGTVDSNPANISESLISWRDAKDGWNYKLDRRSGNLTVVLASATGGNFLYDRCNLDNH
jgi:hypothetical protein